MKTTNIWNIQESEGDGVNCPITPVNLPWYKKVGLLFFRFGVCPVCVTSSLTYALVQAVRKRRPSAPWKAG
ncbi:hypothetical protein IC235_05740 [Hymenobacter sp. BT664]|uniref:Uncharacterized protein n=1 Tax=Hymenobacter montanus TaxID=2771359 RepID=A0A927BAX2_9BACT|nr:hypothetical protein [Hymenobacter montanus]MBD2767390.1 hypothetical protein [Hymenobacter montanus]